MTQTTSEIFSLKLLNSYLQKVTSDNDKNLVNAKEYIRKYFFPTTKGIFFYNGEPDSRHFELIQMKNLTTRYISNDLKAYKIETDEREGADGTVITKTKKRLCFDAIKFMQSTAFLQNKYLVTINPHIFSRTFKKDDMDYLNMMKPRLHQPHKVKKFDTYPEDVKKGVNVMLNHIRIVWANDQESMYNYMINWLSCTIMGRKLRTLLYLQSTERTGKSIVIDFIQKYVLGPHTTHVTSSLEEIDKWTKPLEGRMLVNFNELPCAGMNQWRGIMDALKSLVTEQYFSVTQRYCDSYSQRNTFNIIVTSNNNAINVSVNNHARIVSADVSEARLGDLGYFTEFKKQISRSDVGEAFFAYMKEHFETTGKFFNCDMKPTTESMRDKIASNLPSYVDFIKANFIKEKVDIENTTDDFYTDYNVYCSEQKLRPLKKAMLGTHLKKLGITKVRRLVSGERFHYYVANYKDLLSLFTKKLWIHDTDDIDDEDDKPLEILTELPKCIIDPYTVYTLYKES